VDGLRWRNSPKLGPYQGALAAGRQPPRELEELDHYTRRVERLMLALRLDEPVALEEVEEAVDVDSLARLVALGLVETTGRGLRLTRRGRFLGGGVTAALAAEIPAKQVQLTA
jgi:coproporphyrinogen III oxidase-like Fe-S oxidoreductase